MRLSNKYQTIIKEKFLQIFGNKSNIYLFGSRVDDTKKGGDIDLYIITDKKLSSEIRFEKKIKFISQLQLSLGEQKFDVIISKDPTRLIEQEAIKNGIKL